LFFGRPFWHGRSDPAKARPLLTLPCYPLQQRDGRASLPVGVIGLIDTGKRQTARPGSRPGSLALFLGHVPEHRAPSPCSQPTKPSKEPSGRPSASPRPALHVPMASQAPTTGCFTGYAVAHHALTPGINRTWPDPPTAIVASALGLQPNDTFAIVGHPSRSPLPP
jgi:hypothetical protein